MGKKIINKEYDSDIYDDVDIFHEQKDFLNLNENNNNNDNDNSIEELSDEEVMKLNSSSDLESDNGSNLDSDDNFNEFDYENSNNSEIDEHDLKGWGKSKKNYYDADEIENDQDAEEEEKKVIDLQKKHLSELGLNDYFDNDILEEWNGNNNNNKSNNDKISNNDNSIQKQDIGNLSLIERLDIIKETRPETILLSNEYIELLNNLKDLKNLKNLKIFKNNENLKKLYIFKEKSLLLYLASISCYFLLLTSEEEKKNNYLSDLSSHPIMESLIKGRELWRIANEEFYIDFENFSLNDDDKINNKFDQNFEILENNINNSDENENESIKFSNKDNITKNLHEKSELGLKNLSIDMFKNNNNNKNINKNFNKILNDFSDGINDDDIENEAKEARKRSLRFYTSKIDKKDSNKLKRIMGDEDIPYKERDYERRQRLTEEARLRGLSNKDGADLGDSDVDDDNNDNNNNNNKNLSDEENDYYNMVASAKRQKVQLRKEAHELAVAAAKEGKLSQIDESLGEDGKRAITYQIMKNKGLSDKNRKKADRNSRVKKRKKYEQAKKKLSSTKAIYKAPEGNYQGEATGIRKNLSRGRKFNS